MAMPDPEWSAVKAELEVMLESDCAALEKPAVDRDRAQFLRGRIWAFRFALDTPRRHEERLNVLKNDRGTGIVVA